MDDRLKLGLSFDAERLKSDLVEVQSNRESWTDHFVPQNYEGSWSIIPLRCPASAIHPIQKIYSDPTCTEFVDTAFLQADSYFREVIDTFLCPLKAVRLMKLAVGSKIKEHQDYDLDFESGAVRLHIPIITNPDVDFRLNGTKVVMGEGECWYLRLSDPHSVENLGETDRVHLVIDSEVNPWLADLMGSDN